MMRHEAGGYGPEYGLKTECMILFVLGFEIASDIAAIMMYMDLTMDCNMKQCAS